jgi:hypothetical protein
MQHYTVYFIWKLLYIFRVVQSLIIRSANTVSAASGICQTGTAACRYRYSCLRSWRWVVVPPEKCRAISIQSKLCNVASCWIYIRIFLRCTNPWTLRLLRNVTDNYELEWGDSTFLRRSMFELHSCSLKGRVTNTSQKTATSFFEVVLFEISVDMYETVDPVAAGSQTWVCGRLLAGMAGSIPTVIMDVCLL